MKKSLVLTFCLGLLLVTGGTGYAIPLIWDVGAAGAPGTAFDANTLTGIFDQIGFDSQTSTIQYDTDSSGTLTVGDRFNDSGDLRVNGLIAAGIIDTEGLNQFGGYEVTATWNNLTGYVAGISGPPTNTELDLIYDGGTINFYLDTGLNSLFANPAGTNPKAGAGGTGFGDGTLLATLSLIRGVGNTFLDFTGSDLGNRGVVELEMQFTYMLDNFWLNEFGIDLLDLNPILWHFMTTDMNIDTPTQDPGVPAGALYTAYSNQNGSAELTVVPEPSTMLLLGGGLIGLAFVARKRSRNKA